MKNLKIRGKLLSGFLLMALVAAIVGVAGIVGLYQMIDKNEEINQVGDNALAVSEMMSNLYNQRAAYRGAALKEAYEMHSSALSDLEALRTYDQEFLVLLAQFQTLFTSEEEAALVEVIASNYENYSEIRDRCADYIETSAMQGQIQGTLIGMTEPVEKMLTAVDQLVDYTVAESNRIEAESRASAERLSYLLVAVLVAGVLIAVALGLWIAQLISSPANQLVQAAKQLSRGDVGVSLQIGGRDEMSHLAQAFAEMAGHDRQQADLLAQLAAGDYTVQAYVRSEQDVMNQAINHLVAQNNQMMAEIRTASTEVDLASQQISQAAQNLAEGSTEQTSAIYHFSESVAEVQDKSQENAAISAETLRDVEQTSQLMSESQDSMQRMLGAMQEINESAQEISKVIKVIEDIAFQTNILALNAAVEAARAGQQGKGFAVVAEEVRGLASKSAHAVSDTSAMIDRSARAVAEGNRIVAGTNETMLAVAEIARKNAASVGRIHEVSRQQSAAMEEISQNIAQISEVVSMYSATAEETAAASQTMRQQSAALAQVVARFKLQAGWSAAPHSQLEPPQERPFLEDGNKYLG